MKKKIFARLKPKAASLGFSREELQSIAANIADNLDSDEASDEDIDAQIDAALPYLKVGQQHANRLVNAAKPASTTTGNEDDDDASVTGNSKKTEEKNDGTPEWAKAMVQTMQTLSNEVTSLKAEKAVNARRGKLEKLLKDSGKFGERTLKNFDKMKFDNDEEFDDFLSEVEADVEDHKKEEGEGVLGTVTKPLGRGDSTKKKEATDADIESLVANM